MDFFLVRKVKQAGGRQTGCNIRTNFRENSPWRQDFKRIAAGVKVVKYLVFGASGTKPEQENLQKLKLKSKIFLFFHCLIYKFAPETDFAFADPG